jgi:hypothetical protein
MVHTQTLGRPIINPPKFPVIIYFVLFQKKGGRERRELKPAMACAFPQPQKPAQI